MEKINESIKVEEKKLNINTSASYQAAAQTTLPEIDAVILAAGDFPSHEKPLSLLNKYNDRIICCDGAADELVSKGFMPMAIVGDGDSISASLYERLNDRIVCEKEQESNDLTKAVRYAVSHEMKRLVIIGATGKREDHTLGNISLLADYMDFAKVEMWTDYGIFLPVNGNSEIRTFAGQQISFFCMDSSPISTEGVRWPLKNKILTRWWQATLNEALSDRIRIRTDGKIIVFIEYKK